MSKLELRPITFALACDFIDRHHRHHKRPQGWKFGTSVWDENKMVGVIIVGRPVARMLDNGKTLEVTRCCTDGTKNAASLLYGAVWRAAKSLGYEKVITYTLAEEPGTSLRAAGWKCIGIRGGGEWSRPSRQRNAQPNTGKKTLWQAGGVN